jgi:hypothetical protein
MRSRVAGFPLSAAPGFDDFGFPLFTAAFELPLASA